MRVMNQKGNVSNERLRIVGKLIGVYREELRDNSQNCWTQKRFCKDICSPNTLKNIEAGGLARSVDIYEDMLSKFKLKLDEFPAIDKAVFVLIDRLYEAIEYFHNEKIDDLTKKALRVLGEVQDYVYYKDIYNLIEDIRDYYLDDLYIDDYKIERYKSIMYILPNEFKDLFRLLVYSKIKANGIASKVVYDKLVQDISLETCGHCYLKINLIDYYYITGQYKKMENLINSLIEIFINSKNAIRLFDVYGYAIVLFGEIEFEKSIDYVNASEKMLKINHIPEVKVSELYSNMAYAYHLNQRYCEALKYYDKMLNQEHNDYIDAYVFMADCQNHLNMKINIPVVDDSTYLRYPVDVKIMYKYFTLDSDIPDFAKENFIIKKILPLLTDAEYIKVFRFEMIRLVNETGHYKSTHIFDLKVEENSKK